MQGSPTDYRFDRFVIDLRRGVLLAAGVECPLRPKSFALLCYLAERAGRLVGREEIMSAVWPDTYVTEDSITQCIRDIRRALGEEAAHLLRTLPRRGYVLSIEHSVSAPVSETAETGTALPRPPTGRPMVLILPFENIGGDPEQDYFASGLRADLITDLTRFQELQIAAPARPGSLPDQGIPRGACYTLGGTVRRAGGRIRVTVQLNDADGGVTLWAERYDRLLEDLFALQEDLPNHIAASVETRVGREGLRRIRRQSPANLDAYDLYLHGRALHGLATERDTALAQQLFDRAIVADPVYAPAHAWQAYTVMRGFTLGWGSVKGRAALDLALSLARRAVALEPESALCLARMALVLALMGHHTEAMEAAERGVRGNPCDAASRATHGEVLSMSGRHADGVRALQTALTLNPFPPPFWYGTLGRALLLAGKHDDALAALLRCRAEAPDYRPCHSSLMVAFAETGQLEAAREAAREFLRLRPGFVVQDYDGVFGFRQQADTDRFLSAFKAAGLR